MDNVRYRFYITLGAIVVAFAAMGARICKAGEPVPRYSLGYATLSAAAPPMASGPIELDAALSPVVAPASVPPVQSGLRFTLISGATPSNLVCYSDTVFRNDFDTDGF